VNNLPKVVTLQWNDRVEPTNSLSRKSNAIIITPPSSCWCREGCWLLKECWTLQFSNIPFWQTSCYFCKY